MVCDQQTDLLAQVTCKQIRARDRGGIASGFGNMSKAEAIINRCKACGCETDLGIERAVAHIRRAIVQYVTEALAKISRRGVIEFDQAINSGDRIGEGLMTRRFGGGDCKGFRVSHCDALRINFKAIFMLCSIPENGIEPGMLQGHFRNATCLLLAIAFAFPR